MNRRKGITLIICVALLVTLFSGCSSKKNDYDEAVRLYQDGLYDKALAKFQTLGDYEASEEYKIKCLEKQLVGNWGSLLGETGYWYLDVFTADYHIDRYTGSQSNVSFNTSGTWSITESEITTVTDKGGTQTWPITIKDGVISFYELRDTGIQFVKLDD